MLHNQVKCDERENEVEIFINAFPFDINTSKVLKRWFFFVQNEEKKQLIEICDQSSMLKKNGSVTKKSIGENNEKKGGFKK